MKCTVFTMQIGRPISISQENLIKFLGRSLGKLIMRGKLKNHKLSLSVGAFQGGAAILQYSVLQVSGAYIGSITVLYSDSMTV